MSYVWTAPASCTCVYEIIYQRKYFFLKKWVRQRKCVCCIRICRHTFVCIRFCFSKYFFKIICEIHHKLVVSRQPYVYLRLVNIPIRNLILYLLSVCWCVSKVTYNHVLCGYSGIYNVQTVVIADTYLDILV